MRAHFDTYPAQTPQAMDNLKHGMDVAAVSTAFAALAGWLPTIASMLSIIWLSIQIFDWIRKRNASQHSQVKE